LLEVIYDTTTGEVRAWNADTSVKGNLKPREGQKVVILDTNLPSFESDWYRVDFIKQEIIGNPNYKSVPPRNLLAELDELKAEVKKIGGRG